MIQSPHPPPLSTTPSLPMRMLVTGAKPLPLLTFIVSRGMFSRGLFQKLKSIIITTLRLVLIVDIIYSSIMLQIAKLKIWNTPSHILETMQLSVTCNVAIYSSSFCQISGWDSDSVM